MIEREPQLAARFNKGKLRYDLLEPFAMEQLVKIFSKGAEKYGDKNWLKGMEWSKCLASLKRHIAAFENGEDIDPELGTYHMANAAWNCLAIVSYYKHAPHLDDRDHSYLKNKRIGLDIDDVLADFVPYWCKYFNKPIPEFWTFDRDIRLKFEELKDNKEFWMSIPVKTNPKDIPFEPACYITSRPICKEWTEEWLSKHGFPEVPVFSLGFNESKVEAAQLLGLDLMVDENFRDLNKAGILTYLFDAKHNQRYNVGYRRVYSLKDIPL